MLPNKAALARLIDHALLAPDLTDEQIMRGLTFARETECFAVCVHPADVAMAARVLENSKTIVCTVVGFPWANKPLPKKPKRLPELLKRARQNWIWCCRSVI